MSAKLVAYLRDRVSVSFDGHDFTIYTDNEFGAGNHIALNPEVMAAFDRFRERIEQEAEE